MDAVAELAENARIERNIRVNAEVVKLVASATKVLTPVPKLATPFVPKYDVVSPTCCWLVRLLDIKGRKRTGFLRGPYRMGVVGEIGTAYTAAENAFRNWTILSIEPTEETAPPPGAKPRAIDPESHSFGVLEQIHSHRLR